MQNSITTELSRPKGGRIQSHYKEDSREATAEGPEGHPPARAQAPQCPEDSAALWDLLAYVIAVVFARSQEIQQRASQERHLQEPIHVSFHYHIIKAGEEPKMSLTRTNET